MEYSYCKALVGGLLTRCLPLSLSPHKSPRCGGSESECEPHQSFSPAQVQSHSVLRTAQNLENGILTATYLHSYRFPIALSCATPTMSRGGRGGGRGRGGRRNGPDIEYEDEEQPKLPTATEPEPLFPVSEKALKNTTLD